MGRSAMIALQDRNSTIEMATLDDEIASILTAIEMESVPDDLAILAAKLQEALLDRKRRLNPN